MRVMMLWEVTFCHITTQGLNEEVLMEYRFSEQQEMFRNQIRDFLEKECPRTLVKEIKQKKLDYTPELYHKMADLGWLGIMIPEEYGGIGGSWIDATILYEELGQALAPIPHHSSVVIGGQLIGAFGSDAQKEELLPQIAKGEIILAFALTEPESGSELKLLTTKANADGKGYVLNGTKLFVNYAHIANYIITVSQLADSNRVGVFLVKGQEPGLSCTPLDTLSGERLCEVTLEEVRVSKEYLLPKLDENEKLKEAILRTKVLRCAEMVGNFQTALDMTIDYSKQRIAYDHPIGFFQALQHKMVDMAIAIEGMRWLVYNTAWLNSQGIQATKEAMMLQLQAWQLCDWLCMQAIHINGAISLSQDHDLSMYWMRAKSMQLNLDSIESVKEVIAQEIGI